MVLWTALVVVGAVVADLVWSRTNDPSLVERTLGGVLVLGIVFSRRARIWIVLLLARGQVGEDDLHPADAWFGRALQIWLFPFAVALIAEPIAHVYSVRYPEIVALSAMVGAIIAWCVLILERRTTATRMTGAYDPQPWWQFALRRPTFILLLGFVGGASLAAAPLYVNSIIRAVPWTQGNWAPVIVASFLGGLLALTRWEAVM